MVVGPAGDEQPGRRGQRLISRDRRLVVIGMMHLDRRPPRRARSRERDRRSRSCPDARATTRRARARRARRRRAPRDRCAGRTRAVPCRGSDRTRRRRRVAWPATTRACATSGRPTDASLSIALPASSADASTPTPRASSRARISVDALTPRRALRREKRAQLGIVRRRGNSRGRARRARRGSR